MAKTLYPVRCSSCRKRLGWGRLENTFRGIYCSELCELSTENRGTERRDDIICHLARRGSSQLALAAEFDISRQRIAQILQQRGVLTTQEVR
jgi:hypothetical protein